MNPLLRLPVGSTGSGTGVVPQVVDRLRAALDGSGPAVAPVAGGARAGTSDAPPGAGPGAAPRTVPDGVALVVATSGSTGSPREVLLDRSALLASATATEQRLDGPGRWVLALPLAHVAGLQVLVRSIVAGTSPVVLPPGTGFDPATLAAAATAAADGPGAGVPLYTSLVPTQLHRVVAAAADGLPSALAPLRRFSAVLVGGAAAAPHLVERARALGLRVVTTYGMTETCGGCVYDGVPLDGVRVRVDGPDPSGPLLLAGPVLARGYLGPVTSSGTPTVDDARFAAGPDGVRWFATQDLGAWEDGRLQVLGRVDDVLVTGGHKVAPAAVEAVLAGLPGVAGVCVVGVPDPEWGQRVTAVVVPAERAPGGGRGAGPSLADVRDAVARTLGPAAAPRDLLLADALPERGPGKTDRAEVARRAAARTTRRT